MAKKREKSKFSDKESIARFKAALRGAFRGAPKKVKSSKTKN